MPKEPLVNLVSTTNGRVFALPPDEAAQAVEAGLAVPEGETSAIARTVQHKEKVRHSNLEDKIQAGGMGVTDTMSLGLSSLFWSDEQKKAAQYNPGYYTGGSLAAIVATIPVGGATAGAKTATGISKYLAPSSATALTKLASKSPAGLLQRGALAAGEGTAAKLAAMAGRNPEELLGIARAVQGTIEGGGFAAASAISQNVIHDEPLTSELLSSTLGGAAFGFGFGGLGGTLEARAAKRYREMAGKVNPMLDEKQLTELNDSINEGLAGVRRGVREWGEEAAASRYYDPNAPRPPKPGNAFDLEPVDLTDEARAYVEPPPVPRPGKPAPPPLTPRQQQAAARNAEDLAAKRAYAAAPQQVRVQSAEQQGAARAAAAKEYLLRRDVELAIDAEVDTLRSQDIIDEFLTPPKPPEAPVAEPRPTPPLSWSPRLQQGTKSRITYAEARKQAGLPERERWLKARKEQQRVERRKLVMERELARQEKELADLWENASPETAAAIQKEARRKLIAERAQAKKAYDELKAAEDEMISLEQKLEAEAAERDLRFAQEAADEMLAGIEAEQAAVRIQQMRDRARKELEALYADKLKKAEARLAAAEKYAAERAAREAAQRAATEIPPDVKARLSSPRQATKALKDLPAPDKAANIFFEETVGGRAATSFTRYAAAEERFMRTWGAATKRLDGTPSKIDVSKLAKAKSPDEALEMVRVWDEWRNELFEINPLAAGRVDQLWDDVRMTVSAKFHGPMERIATMDSASLSAATGLKLEDVDALSPSARKMLGMYSVVREGSDAVRQAVKQHALEVAKTARAARGNILNPMLRKAGASLLAAKVTSLPFFATWAVVDIAGAGLWTISKALGTAAKGKFSSKLAIAGQNTVKNYRKNAKALENMALMSKFTDKDSLADELTKYREAHKPEGYEQARKVLTAAAADKGAYASVLSDALAPLMATHPVVGDLVHQQTMQKLDFLTSKLPKPPMGFPAYAYSYWQPSSADIASFNRYVSATLYPVQELERALRSGVVPMELKETLTLMHPRIYAYAKDEAVRMLSELKKPPSYRTRLVYSTLFDLPLEVTKDPVFVRAQLASQATAMEEEQTRSIPPSSAALSKSVENTKTKGQKQQER